MGNPDERQLGKIIAKAKGDPAFKQKLLSGELSGEELQSVAGGLGWPDMERADEEIAASLTVTEEVVRKRRQIARHWLKTGGIEPE